MAARDQVILDSDLIQLAHAHHLVQVARGTVYRWYANDWIKAHELFTPGGGAKLYVYAGDVRRLHHRLREKRHAERRLHKA